MKHEREASTICKKCGKTEAESPQWDHNCTGYRDREPTIVVNNDKHGVMFSHPYLKE